MTAPPVALIAIRGKHPTPLQRHAINTPPTTLLSPSIQSHEAALIRKRLHTKLRWQTHLQNSFCHQSAAIQMNNQSLTSEMAKTRRMCNKMMQREMRRPDRSSRFTYSSPTASRAQSLLEARVWHCGATTSSLHLPSTRIARSVNATRTRRSSGACRVSLSSYVSLPSSSLDCASAIYANPLSLKTAYDQHPVHPS